MPQFWDRFNKLPKEVQYVENIVIGRARSSPHPSPPRHGEFRATHRRGGSRTKAGEDERTGDYATGIGRGAAKECSRGRKSPACELCTMQVAQRRKNRSITGSLLSPLR